MASYYFDSSALAKLYHSEAGSEAVDSIARSPGNRVVLSRLAVIEIFSVFAIKVRTGFLGHDDATLLRSQFVADLLARKFDVYSVGHFEFDLAERLVVRYAEEHRLRALDAIQLAVAISLRETHLADFFVAADKTLCQVAALEGFRVLNPESRT